MRKEHHFLRVETADCESYWPSVEPYSSCPQLEGAREEQQFLRDETADLQARFSELYAEVKEAPNARAEQRAQRSVQEAERQVKSFGNETLLTNCLIKQHPQARAEQRAQRPVQQVERQVNRVCQLSDG